MVARYLQYTFNGKGEFVLARVNTKDNRLDIQARFEQMPINLYGEVKATQMTSLVARGNLSTIVEVRARPPDAQWRYRLDVFVDKKRVYFDRPALKFQHFRGRFTTNRAIVLLLIETIAGVTVYTPTYILNQSEVVVMFDSGAGVEVVENKGYMTARVYLPWTFIVSIAVKIGMSSYFFYQQNQTRGLFGNWSFDMTDDFTNPDNTPISVATNINDYERVYNDFGMHWILEDKEDAGKGSAMFLREFGRTSSYYNNRTFKPEFRMLPEDLIPTNR